MDCEWYHSIIGKHSREKRLKEIAERRSASGKRPKGDFGRRNHNSQNIYIGGMMRLFSPPGRPSSKPVTGLVIVRRLLLLSGH